MRIAQVCYQRYPSLTHVGGGDVGLWQRGVPGSEFVSDDALRLRLAQGSRAVYERHFTMEALYPKYEDILDIASSRNAEAVPCAS